MSRRRVRRRASDIAQVNPRRGLTSVILFGIALAIILIYQFSVSEDAADVFGDIVGDPEMTMPATVLDQQGGQPSPEPTASPESKATPSGEQAAGGTVSAPTATPAPKVGPTPPPTATVEGRPATTPTGAQ